MKDRFASMAARLVGGQTRTAGKIEFLKDQGPLRRDIRVEGFTWDPEIHRNLAKTLWAVERSHSYGIAALRLFSKMSSSEFSPDGLLGGRGYIQKVKDLRSSLGQAVEVLSSFADTMHDEVNASHWKQAMEADPTTEDIISEAERSEQPQYVDEAFRQEVPSVQEGLNAESPQDEEEEPDVYENPNPEDFNPFVESDEDEDEEQNWFAQTSSCMYGEEVPEPGPKAALPTDEGDQPEGIGTYPEAMLNTTGEASVMYHGGAYGAAVKKLVSRAASNHLADSSVDPSTLSGPRVIHVGPAESPEEFGYDTDNSERPSDDQLGEGFSSYDTVYEGADACQDGVTGFSNMEAVASRVAVGENTYSWLPGSRNEKLMPYYDLGLSETDIMEMRASDAPEPPPSMRPKSQKIYDHDLLWDSVRNK
jgi:hypothetical protein